MTTLSVWLLVGYMHWGSSGGVLPQSPYFASEVECAKVAEAYRQAGNNHGKTACVQASVLIPRQLPQLVK